MKKFLNIAAWIILGAMFLLMFYGYYDRYHPVKLLEIKTPMEVLTPKVKAGEDVIYKADFCRYYKGAVKVSRSLIGSTTVNEISTTSLSDTGCRVVEGHYPVPSYAPPGIYKVKAVAEFQVNSSRVERVYYESKEFEVVK